ncbi:MAG: AmmeMemoRadiSam system protein B [Gaiellaceae bacterium]
MSGVRQPVAAGLFYPARADELAATVERLLAAAEPPLPGGRLRALVVPHAGYAYSGAVAAAAFATLRPQPAGVRLALLGPSHYVPLDGAAVTAADAWRTPLGDVPVDIVLRDTAIEAGAVVDDRPHDDDHALEVELPFLQQIVGNGLRVLPVAVGGTAAELAGLLAALAAEALIVVSTDLSHYHDDATARKLDRRTADSVLALDAGAIGDLAACGADALRALLRHARHAGWASTLLDLRTSADASGELHRVVGYGAFAFTATRGTDASAPRAATAAPPPTAPQRAAPAGSAASGNESNTLRLVALRRPAPTHRPPPIRHSNSTRT